MKGLCKHRILVGGRAEKAGRLFAAGILPAGERCVKCGRRLERFGSWVRWGEGPQARQAGGEGGP